MKPKSLPIIDLGAKYEIITEPGFKFHIVGQGLAAPVPVKRFMRKHGFRHMWVNDGFERKLISL